MRRAGRVLVASMILMLPHAARAGDRPEADGVRLYQEKVAPALEANCYRCHSAKAEKLRGGLRLDSRAAMLEGGDTGPAVVPGKSDESLLVQAVEHEGGLAMPPKKPKLADETIADISKWVELGAPVGSEADSTANEVVSAEARKHWAFQPVWPVRIPEVKRADWVRTPVDAFVLAKLQDRGWEPAAEATRGEWLRRVTFDLTGLPPTPAELAQFENDKTPWAYERVVDRLLESPRYGERWATHWLDLVRFAESEGYEYDRHLPDGWRYRDYVIDSLNHDKPFDRFVAEQIAGDEIAPEDPECQTATIFHRLGPVRRNAGNPEIALSRNEVLTERTDIIGTAFLGLTIGCARCHNHKLEPISQKDYYRLEAYLAATDEHNIVLGDPVRAKAYQAESDRIKKEVERLKHEARKFSGVEREKILEQVEAVEDQMPDPLPTIPSTWNNFDDRTEVHVLRRGVWENKGDAVGPRPPSVLVADDLPELAADCKAPRTELARWLTSPQHPLTARVIVNRIWLHHFGAGIVKTANDFGTKGDRPSHPALLDWLAGNLVENGWRLKAVHRAIVLSSTYRQASHVKPSEQNSRAEREDPENRLLWHFAKRRLSAEELRDAMLAVSGRLNLKAGGPSVMVPVDKRLVQLLYKPSQWKVAADASEYDRRSIYLIAKRNLRLPFFETFDAPATLTSCPRRESSTHAPQALELLNGKLSNELAEAFGKRLERESDDSASAVESAFLLALGRPPTAAERERSLEFLRDQPMKEFALAIFNLNGFLYVP